MQGEIHTSEDQTNQSLTPCSPTQAIPFFYFCFSFFSMNTNETAVHQLVLVSHRSEHRRFSCISPPSTSQKSNSIHSCPITPTRHWTQIWRYRLVTLVFGAASSQTHTLLWSVLYAALQNLMLQLFSYFVWVLASLFIPWQPTELFHWPLHRTPTQEIIFV